MNLDRCDSIHPVCKIPLFTLLASRGYSSLFPLITQVVFCIFFSKFPFEEAPVPLKESLEPFVLQPLVNPITGCILLAVTYLLSLRAPHQSNAPGVHLPYLNYKYCVMSFSGSRRL